MTGYTDPTFAFTLDIVAGTTDVYDALGNIAPQPTAAVYPRRAGRAGHARIVKTRPRRRLNFLRWLSTSMKGALTSTSRTPA